MRLVGRVVAVRRFPVKSMAGEKLDGAEVGWTGLEGDRQYAFVRAGDTSHFPWFTGRQWPGLLRHVARDAGRNRVEVTGPDGVVRDVDDLALRRTLEAEAGQPLSLLRLARGCYDAMPVSILTTALAARVGTVHGAALDPLRFRANILVETAADAAGPDADERNWAGADLAVGGTVRLRGTYPTGRCAMVNIDPATADRDHGVLRTVAGSFNGTVGLYAAVSQPGTVRVGDEVRVG